MPITLVLTDDQALEIVSQVSSMLKKRGYTEKVKIKYNSTGNNMGDPSVAEKVRKFIAEKPAGETFHVGTLYDKFTPGEASRHAVSSALKSLRANKNIVMLQKGTYKVL